MKIKNLKIARKFANAFLNLYINKIEEKNLLNLVSLINFLNNESKFLNYIDQSNINIDKKSKLTLFLIEKFDLPFEFNKLNQLLLNKRKLYLLNDILKEILILYQVRSSIILFKINSVQELNDEQLQKIKKFLEKKTDKKIIQSFEIDKNLIAGIRLISHNLLFENTVNKRLNSLKQLYKG